MRTGRLELLTAIAVVGHAACGRFGFHEISTDGTVGDSDSDATATVYHDLTDPAWWSTFDTTTVAVTASGFVGAAFDGRYVYFVPYNNGTYDGVVTRYDTQAAFTAGASWSTFDTATVQLNATGFAGATFDGRYLYLVPNFNGASNGIVARYDTQAPFATTTSWAMFDTGTVNPTMKGFQGAAFDGRHVYLAPWNNNAYDGNVTRYDTQAAFTSGASWSSFDVSTVKVGAKGFFGAAFDGRNVYFVPDYNGMFDGIVARYNTQAAFNAAGSWSTFDATTVAAGATGFASAVFDGQYVYFSPTYANGSVVVRCNTQATFTSSTAWSAFDTTTVNVALKGFLGAAYDGRYVYFVPSNNGASDGLVGRYDTQAPFGTATSWATFDTSLKTATAKGFHGAAFDGRYLYFVPNTNGTVARFDAKTPSSVPAGFSGSFF